jgi:Right handed beta helix region
MRGLTGGRALVGSVLVLLAATTGACSSSGHKTQATPTTTGGVGQPAPPSSTAHGASAGAPVTPPAPICGSSLLRGGPTTPPAGAVTVPAGNDGSMNLDAPGVYWFAPGVHVIGTDVFSQIIPSNNSTYIGAPGAILDGQNVNREAFAQHASNVTIEYLTIRNFAPVENEGIVNHDDGANWTIKYNTVGPNGGTGGGVLLGTHNTLSFNCLTHNFQNGFNSYSPTGNTGITVDHNEIANNGNVDQENNCGCDGGGKFFYTTDSSFTDNYVHGNVVGLWGDTDNAGITMTGNYISSSIGPGIIYEISYNALIKDNTLVANGWAAGPGSADFPEGAIYISNSGGDSRVAGGRYSTLDIIDNVFTNNWGGVVEWEDSNRYCGSETSGTCTLGDPAVARLEDSTGPCGMSFYCGTYTANTCTPAAITASKAGSALYWDCRWRTQNVRVTNNTFTLDPAVIPQCEAGKSGNATGAQCGYSGTFAQFGEAPYPGTATEQAIAFEQSNVFADNTYVGPWRFEAPEQNPSDTLTFEQWQAKPYHQDAGSTISNS